MESETIWKLVSSGGLLLLSATIQYYASLRASTIYFFELDTIKVFFLTKRHAIALPLLLSLLLYFVYLGTKRSTQAHNERVQDLMRQRSVSKIGSRAPSRKVSRTGDSTRKTSICTEDLSPDMRRLNSTINSLTDKAFSLELLSAIEEQDTVQSQKDTNLVYNAQENVDMSTEEEKKIDKIEEHQPTRFTIEKVEVPEHIIVPEEKSMWTPRSRSISEDEKRYEQPSDEVFSQLYDSKMDLLADDEDDDDVFQRLGQMDMAAYLWSAINIFPERDMDARRGLRRSVVDVLAELCAIHIPIWGCVATFYIILQEIVVINFSYYSYYHAMAFNYIILGISIGLGVFHELRGNWITNDVLAISSIYVISSRCQVVSYQTASLLVIGMALFDIFWLYVVDLLSTVVRESKAPIMLLLPRDFAGRKQSMATLDIIVPGIFLSLILKYSSMYDTNLFMYTFSAVFFALGLTMIMAILRHKITPAMVLPAIAAILATVGFASNFRDLWRFMIRH